MKKLLFVGILSILFVSASFAQVKIGLTAGFNTSRLLFEDENTDFKAGFQAGVVADLGITPNFSVIPELLFSQRGGKEEFEEGGTKETSTTTLNYLQLPVNCAYKFDVGAGSKFMIFAGPYIGYGLSGKAKYAAEEDGEKFDDSADIKFGSDKDLKALDFGVNAGVGYQYEKIFFKLQFNQGLSNLSNESSYKMKNQNIAVSVGYFF
ncbi:MAG: PorT family protein [Prolixibacteraceae bacterium]|nr:PorT family protein [Prolixibacteraceae bacterium]